MSKSQRLSYRQVVVGRRPAGIKGLDEMFESLYQMDETPGDELRSELVSRVREHNYIPSGAEQDFADALLSEYRNYRAKARSGQIATSRGESWHGIPREQIPWFPALDETLCDGCDKCLEFCSSGVYAKRENGMVYVAQPLRCQVGCNVCARLCSHKAITFPPRAMLRTLAR